jgi:large subunit ribosomal protein L11
MGEITINLLVEGGKASGGPPLGTQIGPLGINVQKVVEEINSKTKDFSGVTVPVKVTVVKETKTFKVEVGTPSVASLIKKEIGIEKGAKAEPGQKPAPVGDVKMSQVIKIAKLKSQSMTATSLKAAVLSVIGTCLSIGVTIDGEDPKAIAKKVKKGIYAELLK